MNLTCGLRSGTICHVNVKQYCPAHICAMGGAKSKPVTESARQVLAKRNAPPASSSSLGETAANTTISPMKIDVKFNPESLELKPSRDSKGAKSYDLDQNVISEMSKWSSVKETTKDTQVLDKKKSRKGIEEIASATLMRIKEEKEMDSQTLAAAINNKSSTRPVVKTPGRLTEGKLIDLYNRFRDNADGSYTVAQAAVDFELPEELISTLLDIARSPLLVEDKDNLDLKLAK